MGNSRILSIIRKIVLLKWVLFQLEITALRDHKWGSWFFFPNLTGGAKGKAKTPLNDLHDQLTWSWKMLLNCRHICVSLYICFLIALWNTKDERLLSAWAENKEFYRKTNMKDWNWNHSSGYWLFIITTDIYEYFLLQRCVEWVRA